MSGEWVWRMCCRAGVVREVFESPLTFQVRAVIRGGRDMGGSGGVGVVVGGGELYCGGSVWGWIGVLAEIVGMNCVMRVLLSFLLACLVFLFWISLRFAYCCELGCFLWGWQGLCLGLVLVGLVGFVLGVG